MNLEIENKVFIVSGSSRGIGKGIAKSLLNEGARVIITGRNEKHLQICKDEFANYKSDNFLAEKIDIADIKALNNLKTLVTEKWGDIHGIIANAGSIKKIDSQLKLNTEDYNWYCNNNFLLCKKFINEFTNEIIKASGAIIIIGSIAGLEYIKGAPLPYLLNKSMLQPYVKYLSKTLGEYGVRVNLISPGNILFDGGNWDNKLRLNKSEIEDYIKTNVPLNKFGTPSDIGNMVAFLVSEKSNFITGSNLVIDGGQTSAF